MTTNRVRPPLIADERQMLDSWLDFQRATLQMKCDGLTPEQLVVRSVEPSSMSLIGLVRHMNEVEWHWFSYVLAGADTAPPYWREDCRDADFDEVDPATATADLERWRTECDTSRELALGFDLDDTGKRLRRDAHVSLRWILVHMIEEYARHNGHADLLRERIDGATGD